MPWQDLITRNFGWKAFSVLLASMIWYNIHTDIDGEVIPRRGPLGHSAAERFSKVPIEILHPQGAALPVKLSPAQVDVVVEGPVEVLEQLQTREIRVFVQPGKDHAASSSKVPVQVFVPPGVTVIQITPQVVTLERGANGSR
ncbi:MAG: hypothetical protein FJ404_00720 [Verrucomicrobia bacterium]|nr:hypothetical protein [Verrucomicrobiota bacterium]